MKIQSKFICNKLAHNFCVLLLTILFIVVSLILSLPILMMLIYRLVVSNFATLCNHKGGKKLTKMLTSGATMFATDDLTGRPNLNVVSMISLKGSTGVELKQLRLFAQEKVLDLKNEKGDLCYPEFKQYYYPFLGFLFFTPEENFKIENHVRLYDYGDLDVSKSRSISTQDLCRIKPHLLRRGWPKGLSPWEFLVVPKFRDDDDDDAYNDDSRDEEIVLIFRFHHGIGDGLTFFNILFKCLANGDQVIQKTSNQIRHSWLYYLTLPFRLHFDYVKQLIESNDENPWKLSEEELRSSAGVESALTKKISSNSIKEIRNRLNVSFTSVLVAAVAGGLRKTMIDMNIKVPHTMHSLLPIPRQIERNSKLRNYLSIVYTKLPVGTKDCGRRILEADADLKMLKNSTLPLSNGLCHQIAGSLTTPLVQLLQKNVLATVLLSSLPMSQTTWYILGNRITDITFSTSCHGNNGIRISIMSYNSNLRMSVEVDKALRRPSKSMNLAQQIVANIEMELKNMKNLDVVEVV